MISQEEFVNLLWEKNQEINLVGAKTKEEIWRRHIEDSLVLNNFLKVEQGWKVLDLGTGGGFPGVPLAITNLQAEFTLLDSRRKKIEALRDILNPKSNPNISLLVGRAEDLGKDKYYRGQFNLVLARAFAKLPKTLETGEPFVVRGGLFVYWGTKNTEVETQDFASLRLEKIEEYLLPGDTIPRRLVFYRKLV